MRIRYKLLNDIKVNIITNVKDIAFLNSYIILYKEENGLVCNLRLNINDIDYFKIKRTKEDLEVKDEKKRQ